MHLRDGDFGAHVLWTSAERCKLAVFVNHVLVSVFVGEVGCCDISWPHAQVDECQRGQAGGS